MINNQQPDGARLIQALTDIVSHKHILTEPRKTERYRKGFRSGEGSALAVVFPARCMNCGRCLKPLLKLTEL